MCGAKEMILQHETATGKRFAFGDNWRRFLAVLNDDRIAEAERSLKQMLEAETFTGKTFLDIGCGSGLFSLAAVRLGAARVHSFDYDPQSMACAQELKWRYYPDAAHWTIERGSALDADYLRSLGQWDIVYAWGVLHHTGRMWQALDNAALLVKPGGVLFISIYNYQIYFSQFWTRVKALYNWKPSGRWLVTAVFVPGFLLRWLTTDLIRLKNPVRRYEEYKKSRGMSLWHDLLDWLGGYPFEVAKPEEIFDFYRARGFTLERLKTCGGGSGCNEFVFRKL
jgi:2-polyprenyl-3-methyl-5-hydroxy-6-metoxy-1,4-benzoquinol methylase